MITTTIDHTTDLRLHVDAVESPGVVGWSSEERATASPEPSDKRPQPDANAGSRSELCI